ncbi:hypothetical protein FNI64_23225 [Salmonella enterica subsp. salamae]|nr:hypothetical protein [Salmonella enterica subsp. salamae serovar Greenside]ECJ2543270.1 hypothetical protein [Salmonella enterica subsp. salamae]HCM1964161.1 hypothetical protein [Salmonella enterica subsp. salamae serovar 56:l,v:z39]
MPARRRLSARLALRCSFPPRQLPQPAPVRRGHAGTAQTSGPGVTERRKASLAGSLPPAPAEPLMTESHGGGMVNGLKKARRESWVKVLLML